MIKKIFYSLLLFSSIPFAASSQVEIITGTSNYVTDQPKKLTKDDYLISMADSGQYDYVSYLLLKGANPNYCNEKGYTPLMAASKNGNINSLELLIKKGAYVNFRNLRGENALLWAVKGRNEAAVNLLVDNKSEVNILDINDLSPIFYALGYNIYDLLFYTNENYSRLFEPDTSYQTTKKLIKALIRAGADIDQANASDCTPLLYATLQKDSSLVKVLCDLGANPNKSTQDGNTPLMFACQDSSYSIAKILIKYGANVNYKPQDGNTALFAAVRNNNDSIAELLLMNKANVNEQNSDEETPLHYTSGYGYPYLTNLLIYYGADVNLTDYNGNTPLITSVYAGATECTNLLIDAKADVNKADSQGNTPLMVAAQFNDTALIKTLYNAGADLDKKNRRNTNALGFALQNRSIEAFKTLLELGAKVDSTQSNSLYQQAIENGNTEIASILESKNLKTKLKPSIEGINFYGGFTSSSNDFMLDFGTGIYEHLTRTMVNIGYKYRPHASRILEYRDNNYYQFWEKRYSFYLSLQRLHGLASFGTNKGNFGITYGCNGELTWRYLRGSDKSKINFILAPNFGLYYQIGYCTVISKWELANDKSQGINFNRFGFQLLLNMPFSNKRVENKSIYWLD